MSPRTITRITELSSGRADARDSSEAVEGVSGWKIARHGVWWVAQPPPRL